LNILLSLVAVAVVLVLLIETAVAVRAGTEQPRAFQ
jgi:hypothetical protein